MTDKEISVTIDCENSLMCSMAMFSRAAQWTADLDAGAH